MSQPWGRDAPYLSVVVTARNDDHGGDLLRRMQIFLDGFFEQAHRHRLNAELIIVEWNPPPERPSLAEELRWPPLARPGTVRIIVVPSEVHRRFSHGDKLSLFQLISKNVGIRRARGQFILCTNIDLLFSDELVRFISGRGLHPRRMYRVDRYDVPRDVPAELPVSRQLDWCGRQVLRINTRWGTILPGEAWWLQQIWAAYDRLVRHPLQSWAIRAARRIQLSGARLWNLVTRIGRLPEKTMHAASRRWKNIIDRLRAKPVTVVRMLRVATNLRVIASAMSIRAVTRLFRVSRRAAASLLVRVGRDLREDYQISMMALSKMMVWADAADPGRAVGRFTTRLRTMRARPLHTNACGDFTLLARDMWFALRGYPEWHMFSIHLDSVLCQMASYAGAREVVLGNPIRVYHIEHGGGWSPDEAQRLIQRMQHLGVPCLALTQYQDLVHEMRRRRGPLVFNDENWGLAAGQLEEIDPLRTTTEGVPIATPKEKARM